jgi:hypothetical protein
MQQFLKRIARKRNSWVDLTPHDKNMASLAPGNVSNDILFVSLCVNLFHTQIHTHTHTHAFT